MEIALYTSLKSRLETINGAFTDTNTPWFDDCTDDHAIHMITDIDGGLFISECGYTYPFWIDDASRTGIATASRRHGS